MNKNLFKTKKYATSKVYRSRPQDRNIAIEEKPNVPQGIMTKCPVCGSIIYTKLLLKKMKMCECGYYFKVSAYERLAMIMDEDTFVETDQQLTTRDPLNFPGYGDKLVKTQTQTGLVDGLVSGKGKICALPTYIGVMDSSFFMGSMGTTIGEKLARLFEKATDENLRLLYLPLPAEPECRRVYFPLCRWPK